MISLIILQSLIQVCKATYCPNACNGHGHCDYEGGVCICYEGWNGGSPDCTYSMTNYIICLIVDKITFLIL